MFTPRRRPRLVIYTFGFLAAIAVDTLTPLGVADWLLQLGLVWLASVWSDTGEISVIAAIGSGTLLLGLWTSPVGHTPFWVCVANRLIAISVIWLMTQLVRRRRLAEQAQRQAVAQVKHLEGLLAICASCKAIRSAEGMWEQLEKYISEHSEAQFSHSFCPCCERAFLDELSPATVTW